MRHEVLVRDPPWCDGRASPKESAFRPSRDRAPSLDAVYNGIRIHRAHGLDIGKDALELAQSLHAFEDIRVQLQKSFGPIHLHHRCTPRILQTARVSPASRRPPRTVCPTTLLRLRSHVCLDCHAALALRSAVRPDRVASHCRWNDECLCVMYNQRWENPARTLDNRFLALTQIQNVNRAIRAMRHRPHKPVSARLNELSFVQSSSFFLPALSLGDRSNGVNQLFLNPWRRAIPLNVSNAMLQVDWTR